MDTKAFSKIGYGLYLITTCSGDKDNGCIVNTVMQLTDNPMRVSVVLNKSNYTHELLMNAKVFNISVLTTQTPFAIYERFGFHSGKSNDKFQSLEGFQRASNQVLYLTKDANALICCCTDQIIDLGTHTMFIAEVLDAQLISENVSVTYDYYHKNVKLQNTNAKGCWVCALCGWVYEGDLLPDDIICPICKHGKSEFEFIPDNSNVNDNKVQCSVNLNEEQLHNKQNLSNQLMKKMQIALAENVFYVGVNDRRIEKFEGHIEIPNGVSYNSYLIVDEKVVLIDPVEPSFMSQYLQQIQYNLEGRSVDYLVINHAEPDHSGAIAAVMAAYPNVTIVGNEKTFAPLENFYGPISNKLVVKDTEVLNLGKHKLHFFTVPMCHWPESMVTFEETTGILFSNDAFGGFGALNGGVFDDEVDYKDYVEDMRSYYANIVGKVAAMALKAIQKAAPLPIKMIAPSHGLIWRTNVTWIVNRYTQWSIHAAKPGLVIAYGSMYGNTARMADIIARGAAAAGVLDIRIFDMTNTDSARVMANIWRYNGLVLGGASHYGSIIPNMVTLLNEIAEYKPKDKIMGLFGGASWSGGALRTLKGYAETNKWNVVADPVEVLGAPIKENDIDKLYDMGYQIGTMIMSHKELDLSE